MKTFDDKSVWNKSIHRRTKAMFTFRSFGEKNLKFLYNNCMLLFYLFRFLLNFCKNYLPKKKMQRIVDK